MAEIILNLQKLHTKTSKGSYVSYRVSIPKFWIELTNNENSSFKFSTDKKGNIILTPTKSRKKKK